MPYTEWLAGGESGVQMSRDAVTGFPKGSFDVGGGGSLIAAILRWLIVFQVALGVPRMLYGVYLHYGISAAVPATAGAVAAGAWIWLR